MRHVSLTSAFLALAMLLPAIVNAGDPKVGPYGDLSQLEIRGATSYTPAEIRDALTQDFETLAAAHPLASLVELPGAINQRVVMGYQHNGFADVRVRTRIDIELLRIVIEIEEGPRYTNGSVRVANANRIDADQLISRLTERFAPREAVTPVFADTESNKIVAWKDLDGKNLKWSDPVWPAGEPVHFDATCRQLYEKDVQHALEDLGFREVKFDVALTPDPEQHTADLVVHLHDEGRPAIVTLVKFSGNERDSSESLLKYFELKPGMLFNRQREARLRYDAWRSGRFVTFDLDLLPLPNEDEFELLVRVVESRFAAPISQPPTREERALLNMARWLANTDQWTSEAVLSARKGKLSFTATLSPRKGLLVAVRPAANDSVAPMALAATRDGFTYFPSQSHAYLNVAFTDAFVWFLQELKLADPSEKQKTFKTNTGLGFKSRDAGDDGLPFRPRLLVSPGACMALARDPERTRRWENGMLIVEADNERLAIDGDSGRIISYSIRSADTDTEMNLNFAQGAYAREMEWMKRSNTTSENAYDPIRPLRSSALFVLSDSIAGEISSLGESLAGLQLTEEHHAARRSARALVALGICDPVDAVIVKEIDLGKPDNAFTIPPSSGATGMSWAQAVARGGVAYADRIAPRDSWAWTVLREGGFALGGHQQHTGAVLNRLMQNEDTGPVAFLAVASMLQYAKHPAAPLVAGRGKLRMTKEAFLRDFEQLLDGNRLIGASVLRVSENLRQLENEELEEVVAQIPTDWQPIFAAYAEELRSDTVKPIEQSVVCALEAAWENGLEEKISRLLSDIAGW